jgi:predicted phosphodiesterase
MRLGLLADIHEHVENLRSALIWFSKSGVDQVVVLGDVVDMGKRIDETCQLLTDAGAIGVWGNHDFGMCCNPDDELRRKYPKSTLDFMTSLRPRMDIGECHFCHIEPWLDPESLADLWYFDGTPDEHRDLGRIFRAVPNRLIFAGHFHKWILATPETFVSWEGKSRAHLVGSRYFVVVGPVCTGESAVYDTSTCELAPFRCDSLCDD